MKETNSPQSNSPSEPKREDNQTEELNNHKIVCEEELDQIREECLEKMQQLSIDDDDNILLSITQSRINATRRYSSTSSIYAEYTLSQPENDQLLYCIGAIIQAQIFEEVLNGTAGDYSRHPEFNLMVSLSPELGGDPAFVPEEILRHESINDDALRHRLIDGSVPTVDTLYRFFSLMHGTGRYSPECNIIALVLLNRITNKRRVTLHRYNWRGLWVGAIVLAQKMSDDKPLKTSTFARILPSTNKLQLRDIERSTLRLLEFNAHVRPLTYARYYFELHALFVEISAKDPRYEWKMRPMTVAQSMRLELRSLKISSTASELYGSNNNCNGQSDASTDNSSVHTSSTTWSRASAAKSVFSHSSRSSKACLFSPAHGGAGRRVQDELDATRTSSSRFVIS